MRSMQDPSGLPFQDFVAGRIRISVTSAVRGEGKSLDHHGRNVLRLKQLLGALLFSSGFLLSTPGRCALNLSMFKHWTDVNVRYFRGPGEAHCMDKCICYVLRLKKPFWLTSFTLALEYLFHSHRCSPSGIDAEDADSEFVHFLPKTVR